MVLSFLEKIIDTYFAWIPRVPPPIESVAPVRVIAHRGAHDSTQRIIENTLAAFHVAAQSGCWGIELDVQETADNVLVVNHDLDLNRLWECDKTIAHITFRELRTLVPEIPTLKEVVAEFGGRLHLLIELKSLLRSEDALIEILRELVAGEDYHLLSLDTATFYSLSRFPKYCFLLVASHNNIRSFCDICLKENYGGVLGHYLLFSTKLVNQLKAAKQKVGVGFIDSQYSLYRELNRGIPWIFSNRAVAVNSYLHALLSN